ncbi:hypothetical protein ACFQXB_18980 [Plastorhodobacter daqingensis]|uniref:Uncharacterized protein n=1 Tax=Plastorhodobacter daqingensis TaxID=1387281 RepID=A0ABW2US43_9RHOB
MTLLPMHITAPVVRAGPGGKDVSTHQRLAARAAAFLASSFPQRPSTGFRADGEEAIEGLTIHG